MASSHVEVKESGHGTGSGTLPFEITSCESNGLDVQSHLDGDVAKDHTYNKDPEVVEEIVETFPSEKESTEENVDNEVSKKLIRSSRNVRHKIIKRRDTDNTTKSLVKREHPKKSPRKKVPETVEELLTPPLLPVEEEQIINSSDASPIKPEDTENISPEQSPSKKSRKRKISEIESNEVDTKQIKTVPETDMSPEKEEPSVVEEENEEKPVEKKTQKKAKRPKTKVVQQKPVKTKVSVKEESLRQTQKSKSAQAKKVKAKDVGSSDASLPAGWTRKVVERKSGKTAGLFDVYIYSPDGIKFRSRPDIAAYLARTKSKLKVEDFNFTKRGLTDVAKAKSSAPSGSEKKQAKPLVEKHKQKRKSSIHAGKKGPKLLVKLNTPRKRILSDYQNHSQKKEVKRNATSKKVIESKPSVSGTKVKRLGIGRRKK